MESLVVTYDPGEEGRQIVAQGLEGVAEAIYLPDLDAAGRRAALAGARAVLTRNSAKELAEREIPLIAGVRLLQFISAGVDFIPLRHLPTDLPIAVNGGGYAESMAEHALAMMLAACKRLLLEHANLTQGEFNQFTPNRLLSAQTVGILGFGGIGIATARLLHALGVHVHAINRRGRTDEPVNWIGTPDELDELLAGCDVLLLSLPLTTKSEGLLGERELRRMKPDAILVNLSRGEIIDEGALYRHLEANPEFTACIDAWWVEPIRHGEFRMDAPFLSLPNVIASPHNSASARRSYLIALGRAVANCRRALNCEPPLHLIGAEERRM